MRDHDTQMMGSQARFQTTQWSLVRASEDVKALDDLISIYWKPLYFYVRRRGYGNEAAKDIVQEFLTGLLERGAIARADPSRGRFRTFLLTSLGRFLQDWAKTAGRKKRGAGQTILSLDFAAGEREYALEVAAGDPPERVLHRAWARSLWERSIAQLEGEPSHREAFRLYLADADYKTIAARTGLSEAAAKTAVHRIKAQLKEIVLGHLRRTASSEQEVQAELSDFLALLG
ncbi:MAG: RNA polymerase sigma factor [Planctomycetota bacterium]